jgi:hypothetical protein
LPKGLLNGGLLQEFSPPSANREIGVPGQTREQKPGELEAKSPPFPPRRTNDGAPGTHEYCALPASPLKKQRLAGEIEGVEKDLALARGFAAELEQILKNLRIERGKLTC